MSNIEEAMLKVDYEKFDNLLAYELQKDKLYNEYLSELKICLRNSDISEDELINSIIIRVSEIIYNKGFKNGMSFIIGRENINLF